MAGCPVRDNKSPGSKKGGKFLEQLFDSHDALARLELDGMLFIANNEVTLNKWNVSSKNSFKEIQ